MSKKKKEKLGFFSKQLVRFVRSSYKVLTALVCLCSLGQNRLSRREMIPGDGSLVLCLQAGPSSRHGAKWERKGEPEQLREADWPCG